eukprot:TRINITY_DN15603_c0_g1_i1.p1 TRINITY_DN15603_c0_g1~~TRINITY_DN15603_c0_g1_i1.p1  ORF type:complete len:1292 (+),score=228.53 TRINITY_DN15603_c0_g1_i1:279-4154(+)
MKIVCQTTRVHCFDIDEEETVGELKARVAEKEFISPDELYLAINGVRFEDSLTLRDCAVDPKAQVVAVSRELAQMRAAECKVRQVQHVFLDLAAAATEDGGEGFATRAADALRNAPRFPMGCDLLDLAELGPGVPLFFDFVKCLGVLMTCVFCVHIPAIVEYGILGASQLDLWWSFREEGVFSDVARLSPGTYGPDGGSSWLASAAFAIGCALLFSAAVLYLARQRWITKAVDKRVIGPDDFGLLVGGLPVDATEKELREFFAEHACPGRRVNIVQIVFAFDVERFAAIMRERKELSAEVSAAAVGEGCDVQDDARVKAKERLQELNKIIMSARKIQQAIPCMGSCVVVLQSQSDHRDCVREWDTGLMSFCSTLRFVGLNCFAKCLYRWPSFRGTHALRVARAPTPSDILWANFGVPIANQRSAAAHAALCLCALLLVSFLCIYFVKMAQRRWPAAMFLAVIMVLTVNIVIELSVRYLVKRVRNATKTTRDASIMMITTAAMVLNSAVVLLPLHPTPEDWYRDGGLVHAVAVLTVVGAFFMPLMVLVNPGKQIRKFRAWKVDVEADATLTQAKLNRLFEPREMDMAKAFAKVLRCFLTAAIFVPVLPICAGITALEMIALYWSYKHMLLRDSRRPYIQSDALAASAERYLHVGCALIALASLLFLPPSLTPGELKVASRTVAVVFAVAGIAGALFPRGIWSLLWSTVCARADGDAITDDEFDSYYDAQVLWHKEQRYHSGQPVYAHMETIFRIHRDRGLPYHEGLPWDAQTGNLLLPVEDDSSERKPSLMSSGDEDADPAEKTGADGTVSSLSTSASAATDAAAAADAVADAAGTAAVETGARPALDPAKLALESMKMVVPADVEETKGETGSCPLDHSSLSDALSSLSRVIKPGCVHVVVGLGRAPQWNGTQCTTVAWNETASRWRVRLSTGAQARLAVGNLAPTNVVLTNLTRQAEMNGTRAELCGWDEKAEKWIVNLPSGTKARLGPGNVSLVEEAPPPSKDGVLGETVTEDQESASSSPPTASQTEEVAVEKQKEDEKEVLQEKERGEEIGLEQVEKEEHDEIQEEGVAKDAADEEERECVRPPRRSRSQSSKRRLVKKLSRRSASSQAQDAEDRVSLVDEVAFPRDEYASLVEDVVGSDAAAPESSSISGSRSPLHAALEVLITDGGFVSPGRSLVLVGLAASPQLNDTRCTVVKSGGTAGGDQDPLSQLWIVTLADGKQARISADHLAPTRCVIANLQERGDLNGKEVEVKGWDDGTSKWLVAMPGGSLARLPPENMGLCRDENE